MMRELVDTQTAPLSIARSVPSRRWADYGDDPTAPIRREPSIPIMVDESEWDATVPMRRTFPSVSSHETRAIVVAEELIAPGPLPRTNRKSPVRYLLVGVFTGALVVYGLMARVLHERDMALAEARASLPAQTISSPKAPAPCAATGEMVASTIPTYDVEVLPRHGARRKAAPPRR